MTRPTDTPAPAVRCERLVPTYARDACGGIDLDAPTGHETCGGRVVTSTDGTFRYCQDCGATHTAEADAKAALNRIAQLAADPGVADDPATFYQKQLMGAIGIATLALLPDAHGEGR